MSHTRSWIVAVVVAAGASSSVRADSKNEIRAVTFDDDGGVTRVHVRGAQTPTFTVYKLERPSRVVIDVPQAQLAEALRGHETAALMTANTWAVSTIAAQQLDDGGQVVRVIVTLARPGRYDVKTEGNELVVMVMPRDPAPRTASPEALAAAEAASQKAQQVAQAAEQGRAQAEKTSAAAIAEAAKAKDAAAAAQAAAARTQQEATRQAEAAARSKTEADAARQAASRDVEVARQAAAHEAEAARQEAARARADADAARAEAARSKAAAETSQAAVQRQLDAATHAKADADAARREADAAKADAARTRAQAAAARDEVARAKAEADAARSEADKASALTRASRAETEAAKADAAQNQAEAVAAHRQAEALARDAARKNAEAAAAQAETARMKDDNVRAQADASRARSEAEAAKAEATRMRAEAEAARTDAETAKTQAAADKQQAEAARGRAEAVLRDTKQQLAALDQKAQSAQALEDKARAANAAAQAREEAARALAAQAAAERQAAETAARQAAEARDRTAQAGAERDKAIALAQAAEARLASARKATDDAEHQRASAEAAAASAKHDLEQTRSTLSTVEQQRQAAETAASDAARKRGEAEAAASDAARRRSEAEVAAGQAAAQRAAAEHAASQAVQRRGEAEQQRVVAEQQRAAAEQAARTAKAAAAAAEHQRSVAEQAAGTALAARREAEVGLAELSARRTAAEHAAADLEARSKAEAKAQADVAAARARQASDAELAAARTEVNRLADQRKRAEAELADRRKAVTAQQAEADRLKLAATQAHDAAAREEARRTQLAEQRAAEERALTAIEAQRAAATAAATAPAAPAVAAVGSSTANAGSARSASGAAAPAATTATAAPARSTTSASTAATNPARPARPARPATPAAPAPLAHVRDITFTGDDVTGHVAIALAGDASVRIGDVSATTAELIIDHADLGARLERKLDVARFGGPVRAISSFRDRRVPDRVRLVAELGSPATPTFDRDSGGIRWSFVGADIARRPVTTTPASHPAVAQLAPTPVVGGFGAASTPIVQQSVAQLPPQAHRQRVYHGQTMELHAKDAPIHDLLRLIADVGKISIVVPDTIDAKVTVDLKRVPWDQALEVILSSHQLWYRREGNLYRVAPRKELDAEDEAEAARRDAQLKAESPRPALVPLNYASAADLAKKLTPMLSPHGNIAVDERTNQLIVTDVSGNRETIARLAQSVDTQTPQVSIEARIVEADSTFLRQIGVQWGGSALSGAGTGNATGLVFPSSVSVVGANEDTNTNRTGVATPSDFAVNLPAATGSGEGGALGISLGSIAGNFNINVRLSALEDAGTVRIISSPKVTVLNNKPASIASGVSIPIETVSATGTQTQFVQADLKLEVTPTVSQRDCSISMSLAVHNDAPDFVNVGARGDPTIVRKEAHTFMLVADGDTKVLGGIYTRNSGLAYKKVPFFGDLPVIGWLFKNRRENDDRTELLVFITPRITNRALLPCK